MVTATRKRPTAKEVEFIQLASREIKKETKNCVDELNIATPNGYMQAKKLNSHPLNCYQQISMERPEVVADILIDFHNRLQQSYGILLTNPKDKKALKERKTLDSIFNDLTANGKNDSPLKYIRDNLKEAYNANIKNDNKEFLKIAKNELEGKENKSKYVSMAAKLHNAIVAIDKHLPETKFVPKTDLGKNYE